MNAQQPPGPVADHRTPLVSVYMPTRNRASMLERAAASVLEQSHRALELIVVDDGSTDDTPAVLAQLAARDPRVRSFRNPESIGAPLARNRAIAEARGHWITGIDDDDRFEPGRLEVLLIQWQLLTRLAVPFSCLYTQDIYVDAAESTKSLKRGSVDWLDLFEYNVIGNQIFTLTERLRAVGGFDPEMPAWQDLDLFIRILKRFGTARLVDAPLYTTDVGDRADRISKSKKARIVDAYERVAAKHPECDGQQRQLLYLQLFGKVYGHRPDLDDARRFIAEGWHLQTFRRFLRALAGPR